jgi:translation initiation factor IF-3
MKEKKKRLNGAIRADRVQVIHDEEWNLWEMSLSEALSKAREQELDVMEMWKKDDVTLVKIIDYGKYLYRQKKQQQKQQQKWKSPDMKTVRITYKIGDHDIDVKKKQVEKFAADGHPLKVSLMLRWRENHYGDLAAKKIDAFVDEIAEWYTPHAPVRRSGNVFNVMLKVKK